MAPARTCSPLSVLTHKLRQIGAPPSISGVLGILEQAQSFGAFAELVKMMMPEAADEILSQPGVAAQGALFANRFRDRYFPLHPFLEDGLLEDYDSIVLQIPLMSSAVSWDDYHELPDWDTGYRILSLFVANPYSEEGNEEARIPLMESSTAILPQTLLKKLKDGYDPQTLHQRLDGTRYEPVALWADCLFNDTGSYFLDCDAEAMMQEPIDWSMENVRALTEDHHKAELITDQVNDMAKWLEQDPVVRTKEILAFIEENRRKQR